MGYMKISNLYKSKHVLAFKEVYALEKIHGTSAHISWKKNITSGGDFGPDTINHELKFFSGGENYNNFLNLFNQDNLRAKFHEHHLNNVVIYGEAYGGKQQGMSNTYGKELKFIAFDVKINDLWLDVEPAAMFCKQLGLEFVYYEKGPATLEWLDSRRDAPSVQAKRNGITDDRIAEGIVIRPPFEVTLNNGNRVIAKHRRIEFSENRSPRKVNLTDDELKVLNDAEAIASDWVTPMRLEHVLDKLSPPANELSDTPRVIRAMLEDIKVEGEGEIIWSKEAEKAIGKLTAKLYKEKITNG